MNVITFLAHLFHFQIFRLTVVVLIAMVWVTPVFCGEIHDAAKAVDLGKAIALLKDNPELVSGKDNMGNTPLHIAVEYDHKDMAEMMRSKGAGVNAKNNKGETPLHMAAQKDNERMVKLLLDITAKDDRGNTPLDVAGKLVAELLQPDVFPVAIMQQWPPYKEEALKAHICPFMILQATIRANGTVDRVEVIRGMGYGMDEAVINTIAAKWRFKPAIKNGVPIDIKITIEVRSRCF
jgi:TonB family protein